MKNLRIVLVHIILLTFISFISFWSVYVYQNMPEVHNMMQHVDKNLNITRLIQKCIISFGLFVCIIYSFYFLIFNLLFKKKLTTKNVLFSIGIIVILIGFNILASFNSFKFSHILSMLPGILIFGGIGLGARAILEYFRDKEKKKELESKNLQSELSLLRTQINPHFLFNTLNNIDALIRKDPAQASDMLIKLSKEMRYMLYDSNTEKISLASEVEFIKDYISMQRSRVKNPEGIELNLDGNFNNVELPPMLFIPFIENAFKHCHKQDEDSAIVFNLSRNNNEITFESRNCFDPNGQGHKDKTGGIGLELVKKRLDLLYPGKHRFMIDKAGNQFQVSLTIKLDD
jgi:two-component system, LytTR family, sensor kinase